MRIAAVVWRGSLGSEFGLWFGSEFRVLSEFQGPGIKM